jgi:hypothetical protein
MRASRDTLLGHCPCFGDAIGVVGSLQNGLFASSLLSRILVCCVGIMGMHWIVLQGEVNCISRLANTVRCLLQCWPPSTVALPALRRTPWCLHPP